MINKRIVIVGATSSIAKHCARLWLERGETDLILIGRDSKRLEGLVNDFKVRAPHSKIEFIQAEFFESKSIAATVEELFKAGPVDVVLIAHGSLPNQVISQNDLSLCRASIEINGISPILYAEAFVKHMEYAGRGKIALIGSVAGDRGRKSNYIYGSAKRLIEHYVQGLQHRLAKTDVRVFLVKPGPTYTPMTENLKNGGAKLAPVEGVARVIVKGMDSNVRIIYAPKKWRLIMLAVRWLPFFVFKRLDF